MSSSQEQRHAAFVCVTKSHTIFAFRKTFWKVEKLGSKGEFSGIVTIFVADVTSQILNLSLEL